MEKYGCTNMTTGSTKKIVSLRENLLDTISKKCDVDLEKDFILKYHDVELDQWCDVDDVEEIEGTILRLYPRKSLLQEPIVTSKVDGEVLNDATAKVGEDLAGSVSVSVEEEATYGYGDDSDKEDTPIKSFKKMVADVEKESQSNINMEDESNGTDPKPLPTLTRSTDLETTPDQPLPLLERNSVMDDHALPKQLLPQFATTRVLPQMHHINHQAEAVKRRKHLRTPYTLQDVSIPPHLEQHLSAKLPLNKNHRKELLKAVSDDVFLYLRYPTADQYTQITSAIIREWPYLGGEDKENSAWDQKDEFDTLRGRVKWHFRNSRRRLLREDEEVAEKIQKVQENMKARGMNNNGSPPGMGENSASLKQISKEGEAGPSRSIKESGAGTSQKSKEVSAGKRTRNCWNIPNFEPVPDGGEDALTIASHQKLLKVEAEKDRKKIDFSIVKNSMEKTYPARRKMELAGVKLSQIKIEYPFLFSKSGLLTEFGTIMEKDLDETFFSKLDKVALKLWSLPVRGGVEHATLCGLRELYENATDLRDRADRMRTAAIFIVAAHMEENVDALFLENPIGYLKSSRTGGMLRISAIMEETLLVETEQMIDAFMCLMAAFYVFHLDYPPELRRTLLFFQMEIMEVKGKKDKKDAIMRALWKKVI